ncbi:MAG: ATP-binding cassette domain-containing protein [Bacillota bacterium]
MLRLVQVQKAFHDTSPDTRPALAGVSLHLTEGEFATLVGSNGAGKTTLLNVVAGSLLPDSGRVVIDGRDVTDWPEYRRSAFIGRVFQDPRAGTAGTLTVEENMVLAMTRGSRRGLALALQASRRREIAAALARLGMGLERRLQTPVNHLSGGQRQALAILMATMHRGTRLLLLDEHTAALDPQAAETVLELTRELVAASRLTTLMVTHNLKHALSLGDRTLLMHQGRIVLDLRGNQRRRMTLQGFMEAFRQACGEAALDDELVLGSTP